MIRVTSELASELEIYDISPPAGHRDRWRDSTGLPVASHQPEQSGVYRSTYDGHHK